jgi:enamine deaminase RidA (YjgF/YER057c/UK114 family)
MTTPDERLAARGLALPNVVAPLAAYVPAVRSGRYIYTAGQIPVVEGKLLTAGKVGGEVSTEEAVRLAEICALNGLAAMASVAGGLAGIRRIVKVTGFVASVPDFTDQPKVLNGASALLLDVFGDAGKHARSAVGVAVLPLNAPVEVEFIAEAADD